MLHIFLDDKYKMPYHLMKHPKGWKVMDDKGREYSNDPLPLRRAKAQMKALYANAYHGGNITSYTDKDGHHILLHGNGFITDIFAKAKKAAFGAVRNVFSKAANVIGRPIRNNYPPAARNILSKYAKGIVDNVIIRREPIVSLINTALNFISLGKWNEVRSRLNYDKLFHLSMIVQLKNPNAHILVEKNEVINITDKFKMKGDRMEYITVPVPCCVNFWDFMRKAQEAKGDAFFQYDAFTNNCQMFIDGILSANGVNNPEVQEFVLQDVSELLSDLPDYVQPFARLTTNIAGLADTVIFGEGADCCGKCSVKGKGDCSLKGGCGSCGGSNGIMIGKGDKEVCMPRKDYLEEHRKLIDLLERISKGSKWEAVKQRREVASQRKVKGGRLSDEERAKLTAQREAYQKDMVANPEKYATKSFDPSEGGLKEPCSYRPALEKGGLTFKHMISAGYQTPSDCAAIQQAQIDESERRLYNNMSGFQKFAKGFLDVATPIADIASNIIPGVSGQIYQQFAPPGSAYYSGDGKSNPKKIINQLRKAGLTVEEYLRKAKAAARKAGYDPKRLKMAYDGVHKLSMTNDEGKERLFGRAGYGDFIIWTKVKGDEYAAKKRNTFHKSHSKIKGDWKEDKFSPNNLALRILW